MPRRRSRCRRAPSALALDATLKTSRLWRARHAQVGGGALEQAAYLQVGCQSTCRVQMIQDASALYIGGLSCGQMLQMCKLSGG